MKNLIEKFNQLTENAYSYLKLSAVDVNVRRCTCEFTFLFPADKENEVLAKHEFIECALKKIIGSSAEVIIKFKKSHFDFTFFKVDFFAFLSKFPTVANTLADKDVLCDRDADGNYIIKLILQETVYDYCVAQNIKAKIEDFLFASFCENIIIELMSCGVTDIVVSETASQVSEFSLERPDEGRLIRPQNVEEFIGKIIYEPAGYIEDVTAPKESAVLCGSISRIYEQIRKPKDGEEQSDRKFYKFTLEDYTGSIQCLYFPTKKTVDQFTLLVPGKQIVVRGKITEDSYRGNETKTFFVRDISLCTLPEEFTPNRKRRRVPGAYTTVFPQKYVEKTQSSLFDSEVVQKTIPPYMIGKTFCVFDIETTGLNTNSDKIIEIGAVKVVDGKPTETFSTFIDPQMPLPQKIISLTHIEDSDLQGQPLIEAVLPDFYKFTDGAILVGQNIQFDHGFIRAQGLPMHIHFDNTLMDTMSLAKSYFPGLKNYKLGTLTKYFGVINKGAHRAIYDAWATMEVFMKIAEKLS